MRTIYTVQYDSINLRDPIGQASTKKHFRSQARCKRRVYIHSTETETILYWIITQFRIFQIQYTLGPPAFADKIILYNKNICGSGGTLSPPSSIEPGSPSRIYLVYGSVLYHNIKVSEVLLLDRDIPVTSLFYGVVVGVGFFRRFVRGGVYTLMGGWMVTDLPAYGVVAFWCYSGHRGFFPFFPCWLVGKLGGLTYVPFGAYPRSMRSTRG